LLKEQVMAKVFEDYVLIVSQEAKILVEFQRRSSTQS
jgi:hypothetical protein